MAKQINTRLMLKHDSLTNWNESSIVLKPGEVGVAYVDVATRDAKGNIIHVPTALMKVGENVENSTKTFKDLPFVSALAADVYAWAKEAGFYVEVTGEGEAIASVEWKATETHPHGALVVTKIDLVTPAELTTALGGYYTKTEVDNLLAGLSVGALEDRIEAVETAVTTTLPGQIEAVDAKFADYTKTADLPKDLGDFTNNAGYAKTADVNATLANYSTTDQMNAAIDADVKVVNDAFEAYKTSNDAALAGVKATADAAAVKTDVETALADRYTKAEADAAFDAKDAAATALTEAKGYTDTQIQAIMGGDVDEAYNSFLEIQNFLKADETATAQLVEKVNANEAAAAAAQAKADAALPTATAEEDYLKKTDAATTYEPIGAQAAAEATAKGYTDAEIAKLGNVYDAKGAAANVQAAITGTDNGQLDELTLYGLKAYIAQVESDASSASSNLNDRMDGIEDSENGILAQANAYTDTLKTGLTDGSVIVNKATYAVNDNNGDAIHETYRKNSVAITSDDLSDEVFVFNCGTATTVL